MPAEIPVVHFSEALSIVGAPADEPDLAPEHERALGEWARERHGSDFLAVEGYPMAKRPFYTHPQPSDPRWSNSFDLLFRGLELVTGGQRLHRLSDHERAIRANGEDPAAYAAYLQAFRHGMPPHGGFAIGLERWVARLVEAANIREVTLFPRDLTRLRRRPGFRDGRASTSSTSGLPVVVETGVPGLRKDESCLETSGLAGG